MRQPQRERVTTGEEFFHCLRFVRIRTLPLPSIRQIKVRSESPSFIQFKDQSCKWEEKDYLYPIPVKQIQIYPKDEATGESVLTQNPGY